MHHQINKTLARMPRRAIAVAMSVLAGAAHSQETKTLDMVEVIGISPVPGVGVPRDQIPANVQRANATQIKQSQSLNLPDFMANQLPSVNINEFQGNPYQANVSYRGFSASPLLGTPQGLSVYQDGVRINEPFGDVVNWDLIPQSAISSITLMPGSNPLFGLNTLGGALAITTKSGYTHSGTALETSYGSFNRRSFEVETGKRFDNGMHYFVTGNWFKEDGWRDFSPSQVKQFFGKVGRKTSDFELDLSVTIADNDLIGNGVVPPTLYEQRREAIFTRPDQTKNRMNMFVLNGSKFLNDEQVLSGTLYNRRIKTRTLNGDLNAEFEDDPTAKPGAENRTESVQNGYGGSVQWSHTIEANRLALGATYDRSRTSFTQNAAKGDLDATRKVVDAEGAVLENSLHGVTRNSSLFLTDTYSIRRDLQLTLAGRLNRARVTTVDELNPGVPFNLDNDYTYTKFNPAIGLTWQASNALTLYGGFNQGNRTPTPIELGCANPDRPCTLPNSMASDPYLKQVIARTFEAGARGQLAERVRWNAGLFQTTNTDDIIFISSSTAAGYFTNFGKTQRRGAELGLSGTSGKLDWSANYSYVQARFRSSACLLGANNSTRGTSPQCVADDEIYVQSGNKIPGIPEHSLKLGLGVRATDRWRIGAALVAYSGQYARGNENNQHQAGTFTDNVSSETRTFLHSGKTPGYFVLNLNTNYALGAGWEVFAKINNVFDKKYATGGILAENAFTANGTLQPNSADWTRETFIAPGAPRSVWVGVRYRFGGGTS